MSFGGDRRFVFGSNISPQSSGFGGFGSTGLQPTTQAPTQFGSIFTTTGPSLFGNVGCNTGGLASPSASGFGISSAPGTSGTFGSPNAFGFGKTVNTLTTPLSNGTAIPAFAPTAQRDDLGQNCRYQSINFMPPYSNFSFEELRLADYNVGRRYGMPATSLGGFGSSLFGGTGFAPQAGITSAPPLFGMSGATSPAFASKPSSFRTPQSITSPFATTSFSSSPSPFQSITSSAATSGRPLFGSTATTSAPSFGSTTSAPSFGSVSPQQQVFGSFGNRFGGFGASTAQNQPSVNVFGSTIPGSTAGSPPFTPSSGTSIFGKPAFGGNQGTGGPFGGSIFGSVGTLPTGLAPVGSGAPPYPQQQSSGLFGTSSEVVSGAPVAKAPSSIFPFAAQSTAQQQFGTTKVFGSPFGTSQISQFAPQPPSDFKVSSLNDPNPYGQSSLWTGLQLKPSDEFKPLFTPLVASEKMKESQSKQAGARPPAKAFYTTRTRHAGLGSPPLSPHIPGTSPYTSALSGRPFGKTAGTNILRHHFVDDGIPPNAFDFSQRRWSSGDVQRLVIDPNIRQDLFRRQSLSPEPPSMVKERPVSVSPEADSEKDKLLTEPMAQPKQEIRSNGESTEQRPYDLKIETKSGIGTNPDGSDARAAQANVESSSDSVNETNQTGDRLPDMVTEGGAAYQLTEKKAASEPRPDLHPGEYWMNPTRDELVKMPADELQRFKGFVIGRKGCGRVTFDGPVDLTVLPVENLYDEIVKIRPRSITVYPDESSKPPPGQGLNVPATLCIENSWPRADGKPSSAATSEAHAETHIHRLKEVKGTQFISYEMPTGTWTFKVPHFTAYFDPDCVERTEC